MTVLRASSPPLGTVRAPGRWPSRAWLDWLAGTDPGFNRLLMALQTVVSIGVALAVEWGFVHATGALQAAVPEGTPAQQVAVIAGLNHAVLVIAMMLGAIIAMLGSFAASMDSDPHRQLVTFLLMPVPMVATLCLGLSLHTRLGSLTSLAVLLAVGTYCRRFGPRGFMGGMLLFMGGFLGYFLQQLVPISGIGWLSVEIGLGVLVTVGVHFAFFRPRPAAALARMQRSYAARARELAGSVVDLFNDPEASRRLQRQLLRLNETALIIDAHLALPGAVPVGHSAGVLHRRLFDAELALANVARFAGTLSRRELPERVRALVYAAVVDVREENLPAAAASADALRRLLRDPPGAGLEESSHIITHRFATSVLDYADAMYGWLHASPEPSTSSQPEPTYETPVALFAGWLPGSAMVSAAASASTQTSVGPLDRIRLAPYARIAIQMGIAVGGAIALGDVLSGRRFYWAVIAAFVTFMGANNAGEQLRKACFRVLGTLIGVIAGSAIAQLIGDRVDLQIAVVLVALFFGLYLMRINYTFMVIAITIMVAQLYVQLDEFSNSMLLLRLEETALGAGVAMATVLLVLPLRTGRVARVAAGQYVASLADLADRALARMLDPADATGSGPELRAAARSVDIAYQALVATVWPMRTPLFGRLASQIAGFMQTATALRHYGRNLVLDVGHAQFDAATHGDIERARGQLAASLAAIVEVLDTGTTDARYVRSASLLSRAATHLPADRSSRAQLALRDLQLIDGSAAEAARWAQVTVSDLDTDLGGGAGVPTDNARVS